MDELCAWSIVFGMLGDLALCLSVHCGVLRLWMQNTPPRVGCQLPDLVIGASVGGSIWIVPHPGSTSCLALAQPCPQIQGPGYASPVLVAVVGAVALSAC